MNHKNADTSPAPDYTWLYARSRSAVGSSRGPQAAARVLDMLGRPDAQFSSIRVVGTGGKGSTCAMLDAGLRAALGGAGTGARVGRFTSPHLQRFEERIRIDGEMLDAAETAAFIRWAQAEAEAGGPESDNWASQATFFDLSLGLAAQAFAGAGVRWAVMEAGVGGASDATHALLGVRAALLTNVALDHTDYLGAAVAQIARDKALACHALQPNEHGQPDGSRQPAPLLTTAQGEGLEVAAQVAAEVGAPLYTPASHAALFALPRLPRLAGPHQRENASLAVAALRLFGFEAGVQAALDATHAGRMEWLKAVGEDGQPRRVLLDGAHNPDAARALAQALAEAEDEAETRTLLFGNMARKDTPATLEPLLPYVGRAVFTEWGADAADAEALAQAYAGTQDTWAVPDIAEALAQALAATPAGGTLLVTGSLYLVGQVRQLLEDGR